MSVRPAPALQQPKPTFDLKWSDLTETEKSAASLGVDPSAFKPISFLNTVCSFPQPFVSHSPTHRRVCVRRQAHYESLLKNNRLGDGLAKQLEAFKSVAKASGVV